MVLNDASPLDAEKTDAQNALPPECLDLLHRSLDCGLIILGMDLTVRWLNPAALELLHRTITGAVGRSAKDVIGEAYPHMDWMLSVTMRTGQRKQTTFSVQTAAGAKRFLNVSAFLLEGPGDETNLGISIADITEQYQTMTRNAQTEKMAAVGLLAAGIAHEFNNIWASVQGYAELAKQNDDFTKDLVEVCLEQSERASEIIHALLSFSDLRVDLRRGVRLGRILKSIQRLVNLEMQAKGIELTLDVECDPLIAGNEGMLQQIFLNLVINAYQAIVDKGTVGITLSEEDMWAVIRVRDTGSGMTTEQIRRLFEPFYTTKGALGGNEKVDGHGLGLTLTYNLVNLHGGEISVQSDVEQGSVFTVRFPKTEPIEEKDLSSEPARPTTKSIPEGLDLLVVDDEVILQDLIRSMLPGHSVEAVVSGEGALEMIASSHYDIVFLDLVLDGDMSGFDVFDWLAENRPEIKVVLLTGRPEQRKLNDYVPRASGIVFKPFSINDIETALVTAFSDKSA